MLGTDTSVPEPTNVSVHGSRLLLDNEELFLPFEHLPWFRRATIAQIASIERPSGEPLYLQLLDIDLSIQSIRDPTAFALVPGDADQPASADG